MGITQGCWTEISRASTATAVGVARGVRLVDQLRTYHVGLFLLVTGR